MYIQKIYYKESALIIISKKIQKKLTVKHGGITADEITQCFANREYSALIDTREDHQTNPETRWFISTTDYGRKLKIVYVFNGTNTYIKTAYAPREEEERIYTKYAVNIN
jgi:hypothetical protein